MFDFEDDNEEFWNTIQFNYNSGGPDGKAHHISINLKDKESYVEIMQEFVYFLQGIGFTYIGGLTAFDHDGEELNSTDL